MSEENNNANKSSPSVTSPWISSAANAASGVVGGLFSTVVGNWQSNKAYRRQRALIREQREYDSPINKVKRLREAGLSPTLMYGGGFDSSISPIPSSPSMPNTPQFNLGNVSYGEIAQGNLVQSQAELNMAKANNINKMTPYMINQLQSITDMNNAHTVNFESLTTLNRDAHIMNSYTIEAQDKCQDAEIRARFETANSVYEMSLNSIQESLAHRPNIDEFEKINLDKAKMDLTKEGYECRVLSATEAEKYQHVNFMASQIDLNAVQRDGILIQNKHGAMLVKMDAEQLKQMKVDSQIAEDTRLSKTKDLNDAYDWGSKARRVESISTGINSVANLIGSVGKIQIGLGHVKNGQDFNAAYEKRGSQRTFEETWKYGPDGQPHRTSATSYSHNGWSQ